MMARLFWVKTVLSVARDSQAEGFLDCFVEATAEEELKQSVIRELCEDDCLFECQHKKYVLTERGMKILDRIRALSTQEYTELLERNEPPRETFLEE